MAHNKRQGKFGIQPLHLFIALPFAAALLVVDLLDNNASEGGSLSYILSLATFVIAAVATLVVMGLLPSARGSLYRQPMLLPGTFLLLAGMVMSFAQETFPLVLCDALSAFLCGCGSALLLLAWGCAYSLLDKSTVITNTAVALSLAALLHQILSAFIPDGALVFIQLFAVILLLLSTIPLEQLLKTWADTSRGNPHPASPPSFTPSPSSVLLSSTSSAPPHSTPPVPSPSLSSAPPPSAPPAPHPFRSFIVTSWKPYFGFVVCCTIYVCFWGTALAVASGMDVGGGSVFHDGGLLASGLLFAAAQRGFSDNPHRLDKVLDRMPVLLMALLMLSWFIVLINPGLSAIPRLLAMLVTGSFVILLWSALCESSQKTGAPNVVIGLSGALSLLILLACAALAFSIMYTTGFIPSFLMLGYLAVVNLNLDRRKQGLHGEGDVSLAPTSERLAIVSAAYHLSPREREVLEFIANGLSTPFIADKLCISRSSVKTHIKHIYRKLDVHKRDDLITLINTPEQDV
jgi:DNA-binding CsgD family transcriptional regulator